MSTTALGRSVAARAQKLVQDGSSLEIVGGDPRGELEAGSTPERVRQAIIQAMDQHLCDHYTRRPGLAALCQRVAEHLAERGIDVDPSAGVIITGSLQEARFVALRSLAPGKTAYVPRPAPAIYRAGIEFAGATMQAVDPDQALPPASGGLLIVPVPHPATRRLLEPAALDRLAAWAVASDLSVVADETLAPGLAPDPALPNLATWPDMASRTVILGSFATPGLAAWQVSWVAGPGPLVTIVRDMKQAMTICTPAPSQYAALAGFEGQPGPASLE